MARLAQQFRNDFTNLRNSPTWNDLSKEEQQDITQKAKLLLQALHERDSFPEMNEAQAIAETEQQFLEKNRADQGAFERYVTAPLFYRGASNLGANAAKLAAFGLDVVGEDEAADEMRKDATERQQVANETAPGLGKSYSELTAGDVPQFITDVVGENLFTMLATGLAGRAISGSKLLAGLLPQSGRAAAILTPEAVGGAAATYGLMSLPEVYTSVKEAGGGAGSAALFAAPHAIFENLGGITPTNVASWFKRGAAKEIASKGLKNFLFDTFKGVLGEGGEEVAQGMVEMAARHFSTKPYDQAVKDFAEEVTSPEAIEQMKTEFAGGAAFGVAGGGVGAVQRYADIQQKRQAIAQRKGGREFIAKVTKVFNADTSLSEQMTELKKMYAQETEPGRKEHIMQAMQQLQRAKRGAPSILEPSEQAQNEILTNLRAPMMRKQAEDAQGMAQNQAFAQSFVEPTPETGTIADYLKYQAEKQQPAPQQPVESYEYPTGAEGLRLMLLDDLERKQQPNQSVVYDPNATENIPRLTYQQAAVEGRQLPDGGIVKESKNDDIITLKSGEPFKSQKAALGYQAKNNLKASHDIVATRGGWVLMKKAAQQQSKRITVETPRGGDYNKLNVRTEKNIPTENRTRFTGTPGVAERIEKRLAPSDMETETPADQTTIKQPAPVIEPKAEAVQPAQTKPVKQPANSEPVSKSAYKVESYQGGFRVLDPEGKQYSWHTNRQAADDKAAELTSGKTAPVIAPTAEVKTETKPVETQSSTRITAENAEMLANAQKLRKSAASLLEQARGDLNRDRQTNTARRARMAAGATDDALNREAFAKTMNNLADAMERGEVKYLKNVKSRPDLTLFKNELTLALGRYARKNDKPYDWYKKEPVTDAAIRDGAEFNRPHPYGDWFDHAARELEAIQGMKPAAAYIEKLGRGNRSRNVSLSDEAIGKILDIKKAIAKKGIKTPYQFARILETVEDYQKLRAAGIKSDVDLADALIEYRNLEAGKKQESPLVKAERELIGKKFEGFDFFPTPPALAERMAQELDIKPGMKVLEPSAGKGDLADAVKAAQPEADVKVIEPLSDLRDILTMKNHEVIDTNFENFETDQKFDRIIMNPPFSKNRDIKHVRKAYELLAPGGKMAAIMGNHFTFANDKESVEFRDWLDTVGGTSENLGQAFAGKDAFRQTGVNSQLVTIEKPAETRVRTEPGKAEVSDQNVKTLPAASDLVKPEEKDFESATDYLKALTAWREKTGNLTAVEVRRRDRALRYADRAAKTGQKASGLFRQADKISERFYMGQPILVGHHSERGARAAQNRMHNKMDAALKEEKKAEYYSQRAESAEKNKSISSADEDAIVKLKAKLETISEVQERMKQANKVVKASKLSDAEKIAKLQEQGFSEAKAKNLLEKDFAGRVGFPSYALQNNNAEMSRLKKRIEELSVKQSQQTQKIEFDGGEIVDNVAENRLQIFFDSKPDEATREKLKSNGFRWAPSAGAWQMHRSTWANRKAESITGAKIPAAQPAQAAPVEDQSYTDQAEMGEPVKAEPVRQLYKNDDIIFRFPDGRETGAYVIDPEPKTIDGTPDQVYVKMDNGAVRFIPQDWITKSKHSPMVQNRLDAEKTEAPRAAKPAVPVSKNVKVADDGRKVTTVFTDYKKAYAVMEKETGIILVPNQSKEGSWWTVYYKSKMIGNMRRSSHESGFLFDYDHDMQRAETEDFAAKRKKTAEELIAEVKSVTRKYLDEDPRFKTRTEIASRDIRAGAGVAALRSAPMPGNAFGKIPGGKNKGFYIGKDGYVLEDATVAIDGRPEIETGYEQRPDVPAINVLIDKYGFDKNATGLIAVPNYSRKGAFGDAFKLFATDGKNAQTIIAGEEISASIQITETPVTGEEVYFNYELLRAAQIELGELSLVQIGKDKLNSRAGMFKNKDGRIAIIAEFNAKDGGNDLISQVTKASGLGRRGAVLNPAVFAKYAASRIAAKFSAGFELLRSGVTKFADWAKAMLRQFGKSIGPKLRAMFADLTAVLKSRTGAIGGKRPAGSVPKSFGVQSKDLQWVKDNRKQLRLVYNGQTVATLERRKPGGWRWVEANKAWARNELAEAKATVKSTIFEELKRAERESAKYKAEADKRQKAEEARNKKHDDYFTQPISTAPAKPKLAFKERIKNFIVKAGDVFVDRWGPALRLQQKIAKEAGINEISEGENFYRKLELLTNRISSRTEQFKAELFEPIIDYLNKNKISYEQFNRFLRVMHAEERNNHVFEINPEFRRRAAIDPDNPNYAGSGITTREARAEIERMKQDGTYDTYLAAGKMYWDLNKTLLNMQVKYGLMAPKVRDTLNSKYEYYAPLKSMTEDSTKLDWRALGRRSESSDQLAHTEKAIEATFSYGENARVRRAFARFAINHPMPGVYEINRAVKKPYFDENTGEVKYRLDQYEKREELLFVPTSTGGLVMRIKDPALLAVLKNQNDLQLGDFPGPYLRSLNRFLGAVNTSVNPEFMFVNLLRDIQTAAVSLSAEESSEMAANVVLGIPRAAITAYEFKAGENNADVALYKEFMRQGGKIGYRDIYKLEDAAEKLKARMAETQANGAWFQTKEGMKAVRDLIVDANDVIESATRFSAYKEARKMGMSKEKAGSIAANVTLNFQKRGTAGQILNAMYLFSTASIGGSARVAAVTAKAATSKTGKALIGGAIAFGFMTDIINRILSDLDPDDERKYWDKISAGEKDMNYMIMLPGQKDNPLKIPMPHGFNVFPAIGRNISAMLFGEQTAYESVGNVVNTMRNAFSPVGIDERGAVYSLIPTAIGGPLDVMLGKKWTGKRVRPDQPQFGAETPRSQLINKDTNKLLVVITQALNAIDGDARRPGTLDFSAADIQYLIGHYFGGAGKTVTRGFDVLWRIGAGQEIPPGNVPFVRRFYGSNTDFEAFDTFKKNRDEVERYNAAKREDDKAWMQANKWLSVAKQRYSETDKRLGDIKKDATLDDDQKRDAMMIEQKRFNRDFEKIRKQYQGTNLPIPEDEESRAKPRTQRKRPTSKRRKKSVLFM